MKNNPIPALLVLLLAAGCGGSDSNNPSPLPVVITPDAFVVVGPITGFGSVVVNGTAFDTADATVSLDDQPGTASDLQIGMIVSLGGTIDSTSGAATASQVSFVDDAEGPISSIDRAAGSFVVLGRNVFVNELTVFSNASFENLQLGHVVEVSGLWQSQQQIQATFVRHVANQFMAGMTMQVKGEISDLDIGQQRFRIGTQVCDYSAAVLDLGDADLANGMYVQVSSTAMIQNGNMVADRVQARDRHRERFGMCDGECLYELTGYVTAFVSPTEFEVDGQAATTTSGTIYVNGTVDTLALDVKVSVDGTINAAGILVADRIVFHLPSLVEIKGNVDALDTNNEIVTVLGIAVQTNAFTLFRDQTTSGPPTFGFADLAIGDRLEIRAVLDDGSVVATRLERDEAYDVVTLKGLVDSVDGGTGSITILGVVVTSDTNTVFQNAAHVEIDADEFFALVEPGSLVRTEGTFNGTSILATKMFLRVCTSTCL
jgi:hypothetical protein